MKNSEIDSLNLNEWPLPNEVLIEIGRVSSLWSIFESFLQFCIGNLAGFDVLKDPKSFILLNHSSFPQKLDMLSSLCEYLSVEYPNLEKYNEVISKIKSAQKMRNKFIHNNISYNPKTNKIEIAQGSARGKLHTKIESIELADIKRASIEIDEAQVTLYNLIFNTKHEPICKRRLKKE